MIRLEILALGVLLAAAAAHAQDFPCDNVPNPSGAGATGFQYDPRKCGFDVGDLVVQRAPTVLEFQARISDAKLPNGEGKFKTLVVQLLRGGQPICSESFSDVLVRAHILNLEIGRGMSCALDQVLAETPEALAFQICLNGTSSCLPPVALASAPYAVKANVAERAEAARSADLAGVANYAHRLTTDRDLFLRVGAQTLGTGYIDFATPLVTELSPIMTPDEAASAARGGAIRWAPLPSKASEYLVGAGGTTAVQLDCMFGIGGPLDVAVNGVADLDRLHVAAAETVLSRDLWVIGRELRVPSGGASAGGQLKVSGTTVDATTFAVGENLSVKKGLTVSSDLATYGKATVGGDLTVAGLFTVKQGTTVSGAALFAGGLVARTLLAKHILALGAPMRVHDALHFVAPSVNGAGIRVQPSAVGGSELAIGTSGTTTGITFRARTIVEGLTRFQAATFLGGTVANSGCGYGRAKRSDGTCVEVDECLEGTHTCGAVAGSRCLDRRSVDTPPYFECRCALGSFETATACYSRKTHRRLFTTTQLVAGSALTTLQTAHQLCQNAANASGLNADGRTRYEALLAQPGLEATSRVTDGVTYVTLDGKIVAQSRADLLDGSIANPVGISEVRVAVSARPWSGMRNNGSAQAVSCVGDPTGQMSVAAPNQTSQWLEKAVAPCTESHPLICVER